MDKTGIIKFYNLEVETILGVYDYEKIKKKFYMDIEVTFDIGKSFNTDCLSDTLDTGILSKTIREFLEERNYNLLEALAYDVYTLLMGFDKVISTKVTIYKEVYSHIEKVGFTFSG